MRARFNNNDTTIKELVSLVVSLIVCRIPRKDRMLLVIAKQKPERYFESRDDQHAFLPLP